MEMKYVVPDMAQSFGTLEFAGESDHVFDRDKDNRRFFARRSYNLYSDVQKGENVVVEIPVQAGEKKFKYEQKVKLVNPKLYGRGYAIGCVEKLISSNRYIRSNWCIPFFEPDVGFSNSKIPFSAIR